MKNFFRNSCKRFTLLVVLLCAVKQGAVGQINSDMPIYIGTSAEWDALAESVSAGNNYKGKELVLTDNITVTTMIGDASHSFSGTFDGGDYTLTVDYNTSSDYTAPFRYVNDAEIRNLHVKGSITTSGKYAADLTDPVFTGVTISNSLQSVTTTTQGAPEGTKVTFTGSFSPLNIDEENRVLLYLGADNKLYYPDQAMVINACRAYFKLKGISAGDLPAGAIYLNFGEDATGIETMSDVSTGRRTEFGNGKMSDAWYTLDGRKLQGKPTTKGVYINNGKKSVESGH